MNGASGSAASSSSSSSQHESGLGMRSYLRACRWTWCRRNFISKAELDHHVIHDHVQTAVPVRRKDLAMLRRADEGVGESLTLTAMPGSISSEYRGDESSSLEKNNSQAYTDKSFEYGDHNDQALSLPSPPGSSSSMPSPLPPISPPRGPYADEEDTPVSHLEDLIDYTGGQHSADPEFHAISLLDQPTAATPQIDPLPVHDNFTTPLKNSASHPRLTPGPTPTFASLSSPSDSPAFHSLIPESPSFASMLESTAHGGVKRKSYLPSYDDNDVEASGALRKSYSRDSTHSNSSSGSQDSVEKQLTQSLDLDIDAEGDIDPDHVASQSDSQTQSQSQAQSETQPGSSSSDQYAGELDWSPRGQRQTQFSQSQVSTPTQSQPQSPQLSPTHHTQTSESRTPQRPRPVVQVAFDSRSSPLPSPSLAVPPPGYRPQAWYQPPPKRKKSRSNVKSPTIGPGSPRVASSHSGSAQARPSPLRAYLDASAPSPPSSETIFRSGSMQINPERGASPIASTSHLPHSESQSQFQSQGALSQRYQAQDVLLADGGEAHDFNDEGGRVLGYDDLQSPSEFSWSQLQSQSQGYAYPMQTQAPYQSQPMTQTQTQ